MPAKSGNRMLRQIAFGVVGAAGAGVAVYLFSHIVIALAASILLGLICDPFVEALQRRGVNRVAAIAVVFAVAAGGLYFALSIFIPTTIEQMNELLAQLQRYSLRDEIEEVERALLETAPFLERGFLSGQIETFIARSLEGAPEQATTFLSSLFPIIAVLIIIPFTTFFILKDKHVLLRSVVDWFPNKYFEVSYWIFKRVALRLGKFVRGWMFDALFVGVAVGVGFWAIGVGNAFAFGVIAGVGHLIPYFGPVAGAVPALVFSFAQTGDFSLAPWILVVVFVIYALDNGLVQPYIFSKSVDMHPLVILLLILAGSQLFGVFGMVLAVPTATVVRTTGKEIIFALKNYNLGRGAEAT